MKGIRKTLFNLDNMSSNWLEFNLKLFLNEFYLIRMQFDWFFITMTLTLHNNSTILEYKNAENNKL